MDKFQRSFKLVVDTLSEQQVKEIQSRPSASAQQASAQRILADSQIEVKLPFTLEFDVVRNILASANTANIRVYNLNETSRRRLAKDSFSYDVLRKIILYAGYGDTMPKVFDGSLMSCSSVRNGTNFITSMESLDGGFAMVNSRFDKQFPKGTPVNTVLEAMVASMVGIKRGAISQFPGELPMGDTFTGATVETIKQLTDSKADFYIDNGRAYILTETDCLDEEIVVITSESGLLGTPVRSETLIKLDMIFDPRFKIGQRVELKSSTGKNYNGLYKVVAVTHRGTISSAVSGSATTSLTLWLGPGAKLTVAV